VSDANGAAVAGHHGEGVADVRDVSPVAPGVLFAAAGCAIIGSAAR